MKKEEIGLTAKVKCIADLLPVLDTLERALGIGCSDEEFLRGVQLTHDNMLSILTKMGVEEIKAEGEVFDPNLHYAPSAGWKIPTWAKNVRCGGHAKRL